jgi:glyoxylase-like metal-dependent hydrolase (beta-lactamase superfamily II)
VRRLVPVIAALGLALAPSAAPAQDQSVAKTGSLAIDFLDVGQGDAILIRSPEGKTALVDAGPSKDIVSLLRQRGITSLDIVAVSHHHADHYGGKDDVIREFRPRLHRTTVEGKCWYVSHDLRNGNTTCGVNGYHQYRPHVPECV